MNKNTSKWFINTGKPLFLNTLHFYEKRSSNYYMDRDLKMLLNIKIPQGKNIKISDK